MITGSELQIKVTRIKNKWHARLLKPTANGGLEVIDEMACDDRIGIGYICRTMLRWYDKCGGMSRFASEARKRLTTGPGTRVYYQGELLRSKEKRSLRVRF